jgi:hypothetical protein
MILPRALNSNFARDPAIRNEFMTEYMNHVQFSWDFRRSKYNEYTVQSLPKFLAMLEKYGWIFAFKHLRLYMDWKQRPSKNVLKVHEGFVHDALWIGRIFSVLHRYKVKCELFFPETQPSRKPFFDRAVAICNEKLDWERKTEVRDAWYYHFS